MRLTRSGGRLGGAGDRRPRSRRRRRAAGSRGTATRRGRPGPTPSITHVERAGAVLRAPRRRTPRRPRRASRAPSSEPASRAPGRVDAELRRGAPARAWPALRSGSSGATKRSSPHQTSTRDQSTSRRGARAGRPRAWIVPAMVPPVSAICGTAAARPGRRAQAQRRSSPATAARQRVGASAGRLDRGPSTSRPSCAVFGAQLRAALPVRRSIRFTVAA